MSPGMYGCAQATVGSPLLGQAIGQANPNSLTKATQLDVALREIVEGNESLSGICARIARIGDRMLGEEPGQPLADQPPAASGVLGAVFHHLAMQRNLLAAASKQIERLERL